MFWFGLAIGAIIFGGGVWVVCVKHPKKSAEALTDLKDAAKKVEKKIKE
jgi:hypothetical protein